MIRSVAMQILSVPLLHEAVSPEHMTELFSAFAWSRMVGTGLDISTFNLPTSPVVGISSETWLLGNVLWVSERFVTLACTLPIFATRCSMSECLWLC